MIKITNGKEVAYVTNASFENDFKNQGFYKVNNMEANEQAKAHLHDPEKTQDEKNVEEILAKPISSWNKGELKLVARVKNIDTSGAANVSEAKEIIKEFLEL